MNVISYSIGTTKDLLTSRAGLISVSQLMGQIGFTEAVNQHFPGPKSNRGYQPSVFVNALMLMLHEGGRCLDDLQYLREDEALRLLLSMDKIPESDSLGDWLRRMGQAGVTATTEVNKLLVKSALHKKTEVTLDIDATLCPSKNKSAKWSYKKCTGYMPMAGHIAETGQIIATEFREGNAAPSRENLEFIHLCEKALPEGITMSALRIDAAGYQAAILDECVERKLKFAIRAKMNKTLKNQIRTLGDDKWEPLVDRHGQIMEGEATTRHVHTMEKSRHAFTLIVQRRLIKGQQELGLETAEDQETFCSGAYAYRAIAVSDHPNINQSEWVHWYNERGEHSENRIKELKNDFAAGRLPCQDFNANALYFALCSLAYNLFALLRMLLPVQFEASRAKTVRLRIFALAGKVVRHGRKVWLKLKKEHETLLRNIALRIQSAVLSP